MAQQPEVTRRTYPAGVPCWVDTRQPDMEAAMHFYGGVFGWEFEDAVPSDGTGSCTGRYVIATLDGLEAAAITGPGSSAARSDAGRSDAAAWNTYVSVDEADAAVRRLLSDGSRRRRVSSLAGPGATRCPGGQRSQRMELQ